MKKRIWFAKPIDSVILRCWLSEIASQKIAPRKLPPEKLPTYENTHLWKFPPLKIAPLKSAPKKIVPYESRHHSREKVKVATIRFICSHEK